MGFSRKVLNWYARLSPAHGKVAPPYEHVVQIGDPALRNISEPVPVDKIQSVEIQTIIKKLHYVMHKYGSVGMSASQIGVNLRIFAMRYSTKQLAGISNDVIQRRGITIVPFTVFVNPSVKVIDYQKVSHQEGCESVRGFAADVPRYRHVEVSGYNEAGEETVKEFSEWAARIAQHEFEHLDGKMYTDIMDKRTLHCTCWEAVNVAKGKVVLPYSP